MKARPSVGIEKALFHGDIAQLGEHLLCTQGVAGSNPTISTRLLSFPVFFPVDKKLKPVVSSKLSWDVHASCPTYRLYHVVQHGHGRRNAMAIFTGASSNGRTPGSDPDNIGSNPVAPANSPASKTGSGTVCEKRQVARPSERTSNGTV